MFINLNCLLFLKIINVFIGAEIFGRVVVDPVHKIGNSFGVSIEKVFVCSGNGGYIPKFDPENDEFGCIAKTQTMQHHYKIIVSFFWFLY